MNSIPNVSMANYNANFRAKKVKLPTKTNAGQKSASETIAKINEKIYFEKMNSHEQKEYVLKKSVPDGNLFERLIYKIKNAFKESFNDPLSDPLSKYSNLK